MTRTENVHIRSIQVVVHFQRVVVLICSVPLPAWPSAAAAAADEQGGAVWGGGGRSAEVLPHVAGAGDASQTADESVGVELAAGRVTRRESASGIFPSFWRIDELLAYSRASGV